MHEASLALSVLEIVTAKCMEEGYSRVNSIKLRIGKASGVMPEALTFAFDAIKIGTIAEKADLIIEPIPLGGFCKDCGYSFEVDEPIILNCPECSSSSVKVERGFEMDIIEMDVSQEEE